MKNLEYDQKSIDAFREQYDHFVSTKGELFEMGQELMDSSDRKRVMNYGIFIFVFLFIFTIVFFLLLYFKFPNTTRDNFYMYTFAALLIVGHTWNFATTRKLLVRNTKTIVKGVVTQKKRETNDDTNCYIKLSNREERKVRVPDYDRLALRDIVQVETLGGIITSKVKILGISNL